MLEIVKSNIAVFVGLLVPTAIIIFGLYQRLNSNTSASIINKIWSLLFGEKEYYNQFINSFSKQQHDIDKFNLAYGFRFTKTVQIENFIKWIDYHNFQIHWFSRLGVRFNHDTFRLRGFTNKFRNLLIIQFFLMTTSSFLFIWLWKSGHTELFLKADSTLKYQFYVLIVEFVIVYGMIGSKVKELLKMKSALKKMKSVYLKKIKP